MLKIKQILCPVDFSSISIRAYRHALSLAEHYQANLVAMHVVELWRHPSASYAASAADLRTFYEGLDMSGLERLQEFVKMHTHDEVRPELLVERGMAPDQILSSAQAMRPDIIVMGTHGHRGFDRLVLGSTTDRVMRTAPCPVLAVPPEDSMEAGEDSHHVRRLKRILLCTDFSANSADAFEYAISVAAEYDAELTLLHVVETGLFGDPDEKAAPKAMEDLRQLISMKESYSALKIKTAVRFGKPYQELIKYAFEERPEIVAMGVRGRGTLDVAVFGSTTYRVTQLGPCPVLVVPFRKLGSDESVT
ncbi:universal stress protein [Acidicapsa ligni]|uniref:universal stress protein n=1 Tax=Acidicapsa ligni TaxID=542300 RepID=UPI0021E02D3D|nr:universal stress protein [Acidicapsa ligni]